jgi:hypothetical protein
MQPDLAVLPMPVASLVPYAANARTHSDAQVAQIAASIAEFGFVNPVLVDAAGVLVAGHGRVLAAKRLGLASVPAIRLAHLTEAQARALRLADNQIALNSGWDEALLATELARIRDEGIVDLDVLGFSGLELDQLLAAADGGDETGVVIGSGGGFDVLPLGGGGIGAGANLITIGAQIGIEAECPLGAVESQG